MSLTAQITTQIKASIKAKETIDVKQVAAAAKAMIQAYRNGKKILVAGNGGSAADAQHIVAELVGRFAIDRKALPAVALTTNPSNVTAISNDYGYDQVFARQVEALGAKGDVFLAITASGNSPNLIQATQKAREQGVLTIGLTGRDGGQLAPQVDILLNVPVSDTPRIQEAHILIGHILCDSIEKALFSAV